MPRATAITARRAATTVASALVAASAVLGLAGCGSPTGGTGALSRAASSGTQAPAAATMKTNVTATSRLLNAGNGRLEAVVPDISRTVLLIGDSQSEPLDGWPRLGLAAAGYDVYFCGRGGTGYVASNGATGNYVDALERGDWLLPSGTPALIVIEGGGNDASTGAGDSLIVRNAGRLIADLKARYPGTRIAMIGTLARGAKDGGGRRSEVDALVGSVAAGHGLPFISAGDWLTRYGLAKDLADTVHMNAEGRVALGTILERRLRELKLDRAQGQEPPAAVPGGVTGLQD